MFPTVMLNHEQTVEILELIFSKTKEIYDDFRHSSFTHIGIFFLSLNQISDKIMVF